MAEIIELCTAVPAFWSETGQASTTDSSSIDDTRSQNSVKTVLTSSPAAKITWISALFMLGAVGIEVTLGGWLTTFMLRVRHAGAFASGMSATSFWIGFTAGRFTLGFVSSRIGERRAVCVRVPSSSYHVHILTTSADIPGTHHSPIDGILAGAQLLRVPNLRQLRRILLGSNFSHGGGGNGYIITLPPPYLRNQLRCHGWNVWWSSATLRRWCNRAIGRRGDATTHNCWTDHDLIAVVAVAATIMTLAIRTHDRTLLRYFIRY